MTIGEIARAMRLGQPAITKNVRRLAQAGLVAIRGSDLDRQQSTVLLTCAGRQALDRSKSAVWPLVEVGVTQP